MGRVLDADDGGCFDRMVAAIKLMEESILTTFMQQVRAEAMIKHDDRLAAYVPKKSRGHGQHVDKKPHSHSSLLLHVKSFGSKSGNENKKRVSGKRCFQSGSSNEDEQKKKEIAEETKAYRINFANFGLKTPTDMPEEWWHKIQARGGIDVKLVIMKQMFATDLNTHHNRFSIPFKQIRDFSFLTEDEKRELKEPKEKIPVTLMEPCGSESEMLLRQWNLKSSSTYVLTSSWKKVLERNHQGSSNKIT
ncbi:B3 domain-containing protein At2g31420-like [Hevea brasiliensis]|uniref:B3 domain-containing protein At2g31420-like n=1 Tax=Hevea brasiliensis TaxID=3981 RepID=UPI0025F2B8C5|nr:B3 domain-containing protein At2g31420-like [Hevea brasiliensis]